MTLARLLLALPLLAGFALTGPASAAPLDWVKDGRGNAYLGKVDTSVKAETPVCPAEVLGFQRVWTGSYDEFDDKALRSGEAVYGCTYESTETGTLLWLQVYRATGSLPSKASRLLDYPRTKYEAAGMTVPYEEAARSCAQSLELVARPDRYNESILDKPDKIRTSGKIACEINRTEDKSRYMQITALRDGPWALRTITTMDRKEIELATGIATLLHAVQVPQPGWIRDLMSMDDVL